MFSLRVRGVGCRASFLLRLRIANCELRSRSRSRRACGAPGQFEPGKPTANTLMGGGGVVNDFA